MDEQTQQPRRPEVSGQPSQAQLSYKERREQRRAERQAKFSNERRGENTKKGLKRVIWVLVIALIIYGGWLFLKSSTPQGNDLSRSFPILSRDHIAVGSSHEAYNSNPPTSGQHYDQPARLGLYDKELPDERVIHNLEHGEIWISYHPRVKDQVFDKLKSIMTAKTVITPREKNDTDIAIAAWGRLDTFNLEGGSLDEQRIKDFISRYVGTGPEHVNSDTMITSTPPGEPDPVVRP
jgi:hypothetical protein